MHDQLRKDVAQYVPWPIWVWTVGIASTLFLGLFGLYFGLSGRVAKADEDRQVIQVQLSQIQTDLKNLAVRLTELREDVKSLK